MVSKIVRVGGEDEAVIVAVQNQGGDAEGFEQVGVADFSFEHALARDGCGDGADAQEEVEVVGVERLEGDDVG